MTTFNDPRDLKRHLQKVAHEGLKGSIVISQAWLGNSANVPRQSGRMRSGWFANPDQASTALPADEADSGRTDAEQLEIKPGHKYHLTNNLPYAVPVALGEQLPPSWGGVNRVYTAKQSWYRDFVAAVLPEIVRTQMEDARRRGGLA